MTIIYNLYYNLAIFNTTGTSHLKKIAPFSSQIVTQERPKLQSDALQ